MLAYSTQAATYICNWTYEYIYIANGYKVHMHALSDMYKVHSACPVEASTYIGHSWLLIFKPGARLVS